MRRFTPLLAVGLLLLLTAAACSDGAQDESGDQATPEGSATGTSGSASPAADYSVEDQPQSAAATFASPEAASTVSSPIDLEFDVEGVELAPAGTPAVGEGHLHVIVDNGCVEAGATIPGAGDAAEQDGIRHFDDGASQGRISLEPGGHALCLQLGDGAHRAFGQTDEILITVE